MAQITEVRLLDDLDGGEAAESVAFSLDGKSYEIDLSEKHAAALRDAFAPFVSSARRAGGSAGAPRSRMSARSSAGSGRPRKETTAIREWATTTVWRCRPRGRSRPPFSRPTRTAEIRLPPLLPSASLLSNRP